ncbi:MAG: MBL fold metallo-hydrolase [Candidatus Njordarchaeia archaeon]
MREIIVRSYGGIGEVGRSCFMIDDGEDKLLLDCGIKLVPKKPSEYPKILNDIIRPYEISGLVLTHGHLDHSGFIPRLLQEGFQGKIVMTTPTQEILKVLYNDMIKLQKEGKKDIIFNAYAAKKTLKKAILARYKKWIKITDGIRIKFYDAGHVLGSASVLIDWKGTIIFYSGDIKLAKTPLHNGAKFPIDYEIDLLIMEATNALREIPDRNKVVTELINDIKKTLKSGGKVLIPTLSYGRAQEILYELVNAELTKDYVVVLDGMLLRINKIYKKFLRKPWLSQEVISLCKEKGINWIDEYGNIIRGFRRNGKKREEIINGKDPLIILSTSGMLEGGPIHTYLRYTADKPENFMALVNYQVPGTLGRQIEEGVRHIELSFKDGKTIDIDLNLRVKKYEFSGHASPGELATYAKELKPKKILIVHSEPPSAKHLAELIKRETPEVEILNRFDEEAISLAYDNVFMEYDLY